MNTLTLCLTIVVAWLLLGFILATGNMLFARGWKGLGNWVFMIILWPAIFFAEDE